MRRILTKILLVLLIIASSLSVITSCKDKGEYYVYGLHFNIGEGYQSIKVPYAENCYTNGEAYFFFHVYSAQGIEEELGYPGDISVEDYTKKFALLNGRDPYDYDYDKERDVSVIHYVYEYDSTDEEMGDNPPELYYHMIMRGSEHLYIVTMSCESSMSEVYEPQFKEWIKTIYAD